MRGVIRAGGGDIAHIKLSKATDEESEAPRHEMKDRKIRTIIVPFFSCLTHRIKLFTLRFVTRVCASTLPK